MFVFLCLAYLWGPPLGTGKCGAAIKADCDQNGSLPCCSATGNCGTGTAHCDCRKCVDFRRKGRAIGFVVCNRYAVCSVIFFSSLHKFYDS